MPVAALAEDGVFAGTECDGGRFCPSDSLYRQTMAVWTVRVLDGADSAAVSATRFADVEADSFFAPFIERMAELGVTTGCGDGTRFCPEGAVVRAQMAVTLDSDAECPATPVLKSLEYMAEVLRIDGGCVIIEYVPLNGRTIEQARDEILGTDSTAYAVGVPPTGLELLQVPFPNQDEYPPGDDWHLHRLNAARLWRPNGWVYEDDNGVERRVPGWPEDADIVVAVLDTGSEAHRDLDSNIVRFTDRQYAWFNQDCHHRDLDGHGTNVAGLIAAERGNLQDIAGIAFKARVLSMQVIFDESDGRSDTCEESVALDIPLTVALNKAREAGVNVVSMSFSWSHDEPEHYNSHDTLEAAIDLAISEGIVLVAGVGNCGNYERDKSYVNYGRRCRLGENELSLPVAYEDVIGVGASDQHDELAAFSTRNRSVFVSAPGVDLLTTEPGDEVKKFQGTSAATPLVSGVVAHMKARYSDATPEQVFDAISMTATNPVTGRTGGPQTHEFGWGIVDPAGAIEALDQMIHDPTVGPTRYAEPSSFVAAGAIHTCALRGDDTVTCWGDNEHGQTNAPSGTFDAVSAGRSHSCGLRTNGITCLLGPKRLGASQSARRERLQRRHQWRRPLLRAEER